ncbi:MAG TPA: GTPase Era [Candidatus Omnitrophota bacterium]|nr:GTPase Era [Candidatus Omnitrophota bacterium]
MTKSGFVCIAGQPNVGKSTLLNGFMKEKIAITSRKPETTRDNIKGILTDKDTQIVFTDTPGLHKPHDLLGKLMVSRAQSSMLESEIVLLVTEPRFAFQREDMDILKRLLDPKGDKKVILVINKVDRLKDKKTLLPLIDKAQKMYQFDDIFPMSALNEKDVEKLLATIRSYLGEGPFFYPEDQITDREDHFIIQEMIREKILSHTYEEIPHSVAVMVDELKFDDKDDSMEVYATIYVERTSQKGILIGHNGEMLKEIKSRAKAAISKYFNKTVNLDLWVKVRDKWKKNPSALQDMGYADEV